MAYQELKIGIMGSAGYVGGALKRYFAKVGRQSFCYDKYKNEGSLEEVNQANAIFICVPTPHDEAAGGFNLSYVEDAISNIKGGKIVIIKSTVLPGTTEALQKRFPQHKVMFNPEFLTQASADSDMAFPDREIIGYTKESYNVAGTILRLLPLAPFERIVPATVAEVVKYFGNTWFSVKVTFANQMYDLCDKLGADYDVVKECVAADKRIGPSHLDVFHGGYRGYSGACLPKDTRAIIQFGDKIGVSLELHKAAEAINNKLRSENKPQSAKESAPRTDNQTVAIPLSVLREMSGTDTRLTSTHESR